MGAELAPAANPTSSPAFAVWAKRDPGARGLAGTKLQRVQIIKGWVEKGERRERVYDVAGDAGNAAWVDLATCLPRGPGFDDLCSVWRDPDFSADEHAMYYARVVENPTCRWSQYVCNRRGVDCSDPSTVSDDLAACCDPDVPKTIQERAWTSPIWYSPPAARR